MADANTCSRLRVRIVREFGIETREACYGAVHEYAPSFQEDVSPYQIACFLRNQISSCIADGSDGVAVSVDTRSITSWDANGAESFPKVNRAIPYLAFTITGACVVGTQVIGRIKQVLRRIGRLETSGDCTITIHPHERFLAQLARQTA